MALDRDDDGAMCQFSRMRGQVVSLECHGVAVKKTCLTWTGDVEKATRAAPTTSRDPLPRIWGMQGTRRKCRGCIRACDIEC
jgi:hypothetical protein